MATEDGVRQLLRRFEDDLTLTKGEYLGLLGEIIGKLREQGREDEARQFQWEFDFILLTKFELEREAREGRRFGPPTPSEFQEQFPPEAFQYLSQRLGEISNPILRALYGDILWEVGVGNHTAARTAIDSYVESIGIFLDQRRWHEAVDAAIRALELSLKLNDIELIDETKEMLLETGGHLMKCKDHPQVRYCLPLIDLGLSLGRRATTDDVEVLLQYAEQGEAYYAGVGNLNLAQEFASRVAESLQFLGSGEKAFEARLRMGNYYEDLARLQADAHPLAAAGVYEQAARYFAQIGLSEKVEEMKARVRDHMREAQDRGMFGEISVPVAVPVEDIKEWARDLLQKGLETALVALGLSEDFLPDVQWAREMADEIERDFPLLGIFPRATIRGSRQVHLASDGEEVGESLMLQQYRIDALLRNAAFQIAFRVLVEEGELDVSTLSEVLGNSAFVDPDILQFLEVAFERYFSHDWISAIHILVPKLEEVLRRTIGRFGAATTSLGPEGVTREKPLREVLKSDYLLELLGERAVFYLEYQLVNPLGESLRHEVAHGILPPQMCTRELTEQVIHLYLLLSPFRKVESSPADEEESQGN